jgi:predicted DNA binding protein
LLLAARDSGLPLEMPFEIEDGEATWTLTASQDAISELGDQLSALGVSFTVDYLQQEVAGSEALLTDRQGTIVREAIERGYYDTPRKCSLTELADAVGLAKSTVSETLHRAEERVMKEFAAGLEEEPQPIIGG